ncbi:hypothetical protein GLAREA_08031 [Glarea lozoyensis ATCC 20868]|uniref:Uncharacterized protein n=1 Tax=Glarea lozoyensis (strain ATCC 20868 / MF5171) TaxID=1116229 RepID=S3CWI0_GLAL2|nr:uncharacterized protein GLAREA_08031 [Glarea lozoyensis ATCC 20868]EPE24181.1 hypothetical protein GLAREA_08031 [Glarea lozoyensis ATCC 20868]
MKPIVIPILSVLAVLVATAPIQQQDAVTVANAIDVERRAPRSDETPEALAELGKGLWCTYLHNSLLKTFFHEERDLLILPLLNAISSTVKIKGPIVCDEKKYRGIFIRPLSRTTKRGVNSINGDDIEALAQDIQAREPTPQLLDDLDIAINVLISDLFGSLPDATSKRQSKPESIQHRDTISTEDIQARTPQLISTVSTELKAVMEALARSLVGSIAQSVSRPRRRDVNYSDTQTSTEDIQARTPQLLGGLGRAAGIALDDVEDILAALGPPHSNNRRSLHSNTQTSTEDIQARTPQLLHIPIDLAKVVVATADDFLFKPGGLRVFKGFEGNTQTPTGDVQARTPQLLGGALGNGVGSLLAGVKHSVRGTRPESSGNRRSEPELIRRRGIETTQEGIQTRTPTPQKTEEIENAFGTAVGGAVDLICKPGP